MSGSAAEPKASGYRPERAADASLNDAPGPALGLPTDHAEAMLPPDVLQGGEIIILLLKPSGWYILLGALSSLVAIGLGTTLLLLAERWHALAWISRADILTLGFTLAGLRLLWQFLEWLSRTYVLTDRRVIRIRGVLRVEMFQAELRRLQHVEVSFSIRERLFGLGTILLSTAGTGRSEAQWVMVRRPLTVHRTIVDAMHRYGGHERM